jgi:hypothetical protein
MVYSVAMLPLLAVSKLSCVSRRFLFRGFECDLAQICRPLFSQCCPKTRDPTPTWE